APADGNFADGTTWYNWQKNGTNAYIVNLASYKTSSGNNFLINNTNLPEADNYEASQWCFVGDNTNGYTIYNKSAGTDSKLGVVVGNSNNGENSIVKLYATADVTDNVVTKFYIGEHGTAGCIYIELFTTKGASGNHHMFNARTLSQQPVMSLWTTCSTEKRTSDAGNAWTLTETTGFDQALAEAKVNAEAAIAGVQQFYHDQAAFNSLLAELKASTSLASVNNCVNRVMKAIDKKIVHLTYAPRANESTCKYLGVVGDGNMRVAKLLDEMGARTKWQLERTGENATTFKLRNISTDTYVHVSNDGQTSNTSNRDYTFEFKNNTAVEGGVAIKYSGNWVCLSVVETHGQVSGHKYVLNQTSENVNNAANEINAWLVTPAGLDYKNIPAEGGYYVIRSNRGLTGSPSGYGDGYRGTLLGCYTPDREKARHNKNYETGVHLRKYMTGMQTIWKIVPQQEGGYKIYSLMGENADGTPSLGMHFTRGSKVSITDEPTTVYFINVSNYNPDADKTSPLPYGIAINTEAQVTNQCFDQSNALSGAENNSSINADFYVVAGDGYGPASESGKTNQGTVFYLERVSSYDVQAAKDAFIDYAAENRMFELLKNVLTPAEQAAALDEKTTTDASKINDIAAARNYLNEGAHAASTLAFEQLDGKVIRLSNRMEAGWYMCPNPANAALLHTSNSNVETSLDYLWEVEVVDAAMRQVRLKNYASGKYAGPITTSDNTNVTIVDNADNAGTYTISRYYSLDGKSFYANLLADNGDQSKNALHRASQGGNKVVRWTHSALASHWTLMNAAADDVKNTQLELSINPEGTVISIKNAEGSGTLTKTADFPETHKVTLTPAAAAAVAADEATATPVAVEIPDANINSTTDGFDISLNGLNVVPSNYTLNVPAGYFTVNSKLAPAMSTAVKVEDTTSIKEIGTAEKTGATVIYDLQGRRVSKASKGVYIINGVKTLVK
ncbi:MAG: hypothetical protein J6J53_06945, partial [Muribaculaceae bacterium]|nr:hypothetical protein [Muribaculaceae bacterium]